jgi:adenylyltransferase/sulfurtransferase
VFGVLPGTIGTLQATETIKLILGIGDPLIGKLLLFDALGMSFEEVRLKKNPSCKICSEHPEITALIDYEAFCGVPGHDRPESRLASEWEIDARELAGRLKDGDPIRLIDVREPHELQISHIEGSELIPLGSLAAHMHELDSAEEIVLFCKSGGRSAQALELLAGAGFRKLKNLHGGINAWVREVDPSQPLY